MAKEKKKVEASKMIILASYIISIILSLVVIIGSFMGFDMSNTTTIAALAFAELSASNIFYFKKASRENVIKIAKNIPEEFKEQVDINQLLNE